MILTTETPIGDIVVGERHRKDLGDIHALASSIAELGLLQPVVVDKRGHLIAGYRRMEACRSLGLASISTLLVDGLEDAVKALHAERDENSCRKDFTPTEAVAIGKQLELLERPKAEERRLSNLKRGENSPEGVNHHDGTNGKVRDIVAPAVGMKPSRYAHAKAVVDATEHESEEVRDAAQAAAKDMDKNGNVETAYRKVATAKQQAAKSQNVGGSDRSKAAVLARREAVRKLAASSHTFGQIAKQLGIDEATVRTICHELKIETADSNMPRQYKIDANRVAATFVNDLAALIGTPQPLLEGRWADLDATRIAEWVASLENSRQSLNRFIKSLKETTP